MTIKETLFATLLAIVGFTCFVGIPTDDGLMFGYFWKLCIHFSL